MCQLCSVENLTCWPHIAMNFEFRLPESCQVLVFRSILQLYDYRMKAHIYTRLRSKQWWVKEKKLPYLMNGKLKLCTTNWLTMYRECKDTGIWLLSNDPSWIVWYVYAIVWLLQAFSGYEGDFCSFVLWLFDKKWIS